MIIKRYDAEAQKLLGSKVKPEPWLHVAISETNWAIYIWDTRIVLDAGKSTANLMTKADAKLLKATDSKTSLKPAAGSDNTLDQGAIEALNKAMRLPKPVKGEYQRNKRFNYIVVKLACGFGSRFIAPISAIEYHSREEAFDAALKLPKDDSQLSYVFNADDISNGKLAGYFKESVMIPKAVLSTGDKDNKWAELGNMQSNISDSDSRSLAGQYVFIGDYVKYQRALAIFQDDEEAEQLKVETEFDNVAWAKGASWHKSTMIKIQGTEV
jgi:hypothetical protein